MPITSAKFSLSSDHLSTEIDEPGKKMDDHEHAKSGKKIYGTQCIWPRNVASKQKQNTCNSGGNIYERTLHVQYNNSGKLD